MVSVTSADRIAALGTTGAFRSAPPRIPHRTPLPGLPNRAAVLQALTTASDHYPVVADYRLPAKMGVAVGGPFPTTVITGANIPVNVTVTNVAPVQIAIGADTLDY